MLFGHYGDRIGRKAALIASLILMGLGTFLVALVPGYAVIGIAGGIILSILRFVQGVGVGGAVKCMIGCLGTWGASGLSGASSLWVLQVFECCWCGWCR